jgi:hypothetical protein
LGNELLKKFLGGSSKRIEKPHWPEDPAQSPNLFCRLEARLADGHRNAEQTTNLHHHYECASDIAC